MEDDVTQSILKELFTYDQDDGHFYLRKNRSSWPVGKRVGSLKNGYIAIQVGARKQYAHRMVWLYVHGALPVDQIDHINGVRTDNRLVNLREATTTQNLFNSRMRKDNISGYRGVSWCSITNQWRAQITINKKMELLGYFPTRECAAKFRDERVKELVGDYARLNFPENGGISARGR